MFELLEELLKRKNQRFICREGYPAPCPAEHIVFIEHVITKKLNKTELNLLKTKYKEFTEFIEFYSRYGNLYLYTQINEDETAFHIAHPEEWENLAYYYNGWFKDLSDAEKIEYIPTWLSEYVVVAEVPKSANYFILLLDGEKKGCVYEFCHDGYEFIKRGNNFEEFINGLCDVNASLINDLQYHTHYKDEREVSQWIVDEYQYDK